jgi:hypothetical protein
MHSANIISDFHVPVDNLKLHSSFMLWSFVMPICQLFVFLFSMLSATILLNMLISTLKGAEE